MGLGGCYSLLKYVLVLFNILFGLCGFVGCVFVIWLLVDPSYIFAQEESKDYIISLAIILMSSILLMIIGIVGVCGSLKENQCLLLTFFSFLLIICVAELAAGLWGYMNRDSLEEQLRSSVKYTVEQEYPENENRKKIFDTFQRNLKCCGVDKPSDWMGNKQVIMSISEEAGFYELPLSCCKEGASVEECRTAVRIQKSSQAIDYGVIHREGCYVLIVNTLKEHVTLILGTAIALISVQLIALLVALILAIAIARSNRYKA